MVRSLSLRPLFVPWRTGVWRTGVAAVVLSMGLQGPLCAALVGYFPFDGNTDEAFLGNDGVPVNGPTFEAGQFGQAMRLDPLQQQHVILPDGGSTEVGAADYSITFWINSTQTDAGWYVMTGTSTAPGGGVRALDSLGFTDGNDYFQMDNGTNGPDLDIPSVRDGTWHHFAFVRSAAFEEMELFLDGNSVGFGMAADGDVRSPGEIGVIGASLNGDQTVTSGYYDGLLDDLAFYDHALTPGEISTIMSSGITPPPPPPTPSVVTQPATDVGFQSATLNGGLTAGIGANISLYWGETNGLTDPNNWDAVLDAGFVDEGPFAGALSGLQGDTTYFYRAFAENNGGSAWASDSQSFGTQPFPPQSTWSTDGFGVWSDEANWSDIVPNSTKTTAIFGGAINSNRTVVVEADVTADGAEFNDADTYVIGGPGSVTLQADSGNANIMVTQGAHQFQTVVNLGSHTDADVSSGASLAFNNEVNLQGNTLTKTGNGELKINNALNTDGGTVVGTGGVISGSGSIEGDLENPSGTVAPGNSPGVLTVTGDYEQGADGAIAIEIGGTEFGLEYDQLNVEGNIVLEGGSLEVALVDNFLPTAGDQFDILGFAALQGSFDTVQLPELAAGLAWDQSALHTDGLLAVGVPEPAAMALWAVGTVALILGTRRRRYTGKGEPAERRLRPVRPRWVVAAVALVLTITSGSSAWAALTGYFPFDGNFGEAVFGNNGIPMNGPSFTAGVFGQALSLDGVDDHVVIPDGSGTEVGAADYTIAFWLQTTDNAGHFIKMGTSSGGGNIRSLDAGNFGDFGPNLNGAFQVDDDSAGPNIILPDPAATVDGTWHHYAFVRDSVNEQVSLYLDGELAPAGPGGTTNPFTFGPADVTSPGEIGLIGAEMSSTGNQQASDRYLEGLMDDLAFYDHVLTEAEINGIRINGVGNIGSRDDATWGVDASGEWSDAANWSFFVPNGNDKIAIFGDRITSDRAATVDAPVVIKEIQFDNPNSYTISGSETVTLEADTGNASVNVLQGSHQFQAAVNLAGATDVDVASGATLVFNNRLDLGGNTLTKTGEGESQINNNLPGSTGVVRVVEGTMSGVGQVNADLDNPSGNVAPGKRSGILTVDGNYTQGTNGVLALEIGGLTSGQQHDKLVVTGNADLNGTISVELIDGFTPVADDQFDVLDFTTLVNSGFSFDFSAAMDAASWDTSLFESDGSLRFVMGSMNTDFDDNGVWDLPDLNLVLFNWQQNEANLPAEWVNQRPATVGLESLNLVLFNWQQPSSLSAVPEPGTIASLAMAMLAAGITMSRRRQK
jgi:hypothetical protein